MKETVYEIFRECFPEFPMPMDRMLSCMDYDDCVILTEEKEGVTAGVCAVCGNQIRLLCVRPSDRRQGIGSRLLAMGEEKIAASGYKEAVLGGKSSRLFIGAVTDEEGLANYTHPFFSRYGYKAEDGCHEMRLDLKHFQLETLPVSIPEDVVFDFYPDADREPLYAAVAEVDKDWVQYFTDADHVFCGFREGKVVCFATVDYDDDNILCRDGAKIGSIGCVGTVPAERKRGSGLSMVALAAKELQKQGCDEAFIHYTHLDRWYGKLGCRTFLRCLFGIKKLD